MSRLKPFLKVDRSMCPRGKVSIVSSVLAKYVKFLPGVGRKRKDRCVLPGQYTVNLTPIKPGRGRVCKLQPWKKMGFWRRLLSRGLGGVVL